MSICRATTLAIGALLAAVGLLSGCGGGGSSQTVGVSHSAGVPKSRQAMHTPSSAVTTTPTAASTTRSTTPSSTMPSSSPGSSPTSSSPIQSALPTVTLGNWTGTKPSVIYFSGDSGNIVTGITWSTWDTQSAKGNGSWGYNTCKPNCAAGNVTHYSTTILISNPTSGQFREMQENQSGPFGKTYSYALPNEALAASS
jgi:hypothetical protein